VRDLFARFRPDKKGLVDVAEIISLLEGLGLGDSASEDERQLMVEQLQNQLDSDNDGKVSLEDFAATIEGLGLSFPESEDIIPQRLKDIFKQIDENNSGFIETAELGRVLALMGIADSDERDDQAEALQNEMDSNNDGKITLQEFHDAAKRLGLFDMVSSQRDKSGSNGHGFQFEASIPMPQSQPEEVYGDSTDEELVVDRSRQDRSAAMGRPIPARGENVPASIPEEKRLALWGLFSTADVDGGGSIGLNELYEILMDDSVAGGHEGLSSKKKYITKDYVKKIMSVLDTTGDGQLDFDEFCVAFHRIFSDDGKAAEQHSLHAAEKEAMHDEYMKLEHLYSDLKKEYETLLASNDRLRQETEDHISHAQEEFEIEREDLSTKVDMLDRENKKLKAQNTELKSKIEYLEAQMTEVREENRQLRRGSTRTAPSGESNEESDFEIRRLTKELERYQYDLQMAHAQRKEEMEFFTRQLGDYDARVSKVFDDLRKLPGMAEAQKYLEQSNIELREQLENLRRLGLAEPGTREIVVEREVTRSVVVERHSVSNEELEAVQMEARKLIEQLQFQWNTERDHLVRQVEDLTQRESAAKMELEMLRRAASGNAGDVTQQLSVMRMELQTAQEQVVCELVDC